MRRFLKRCDNDDNDDSQTHLRVYRNLPTIQKLLIVTEVPEVSVSTPPPLLLSYERAVPKQTKRRSV